MTSEDRYFRRLERGEVEVSNPDTRGEDFSGSKPAPGRSRSYQIWWWETKRELNHQAGQARIREQLAAPAVDPVARERERLETLVAKLRAWDTDADQRHAAWRADWEARGGREDVLQANVTEHERKRTVRAAEIADAEQRLAALDTQASETRSN
jgi:hypothetical protein